MFLAPNPRMHAAHRSAHHEPEMIHLQAVDEQPVLGVDHVEITVMRKPRMQAVARFAGFSMADAVRQNEKIFFSIEKLAAPEKFAGKFRPQKLCPGPRGPMQNQNGVASDTV